METSEEWMGRKIELWMVDGSEDWRRLMQRRQRQRRGEATAEPHSAITPHKYGILSLSSWAFNLPKCHQSHVGDADSPILLRTAPPPRMHEQVRGRETQGGAAAPASSVCSEWERDALEQPSSIYMPCPEGLMSMDL